VKVSKKYFYSGHDHLELIQEGNVGLIKALNKYDPDRGVPFVYYAVWWIEAYIKTFVEKTGKTSTGSLRHARNLFSLDENLASDSTCNVPWIDFLAEMIDPESLYCSKESIYKTSVMIQSCLSQLSKREVTVLKHRYFIDPPVGLKEIGIKLGVSKERVRQIQLQSMKRLKKILKTEIGFRFQSVVFEDYPSQGSCQAMLMGRPLGWN